jgi:hypothetical protein
MQPPGQPQQQQQQLDRLQDDSQASGYRQQIMRLHEQQQLGQQHAAQQQLDQQRQGQHAAKKPLPEQRRRCMSDRFMMFTYKIKLCKREGEFATQYTCCNSYKCTGSGGA